MNVVDRLYAAYRAHDPFRAAELYLPDGWHREVATGRISRGSAAIANGLSGFLFAFPNADWDIETRIPYESREAVAYRLTGTLTRPLGPLEPRGQQLNLRGVHIFVSDGEHIASGEDYWDALTFRRQMERP